MTAPAPRQRAVAPLLLIGSAFEFSKTTQLGLEVLGGGPAPMPGGGAVGGCSAQPAPISILDIEISEIFQKLRQIWLKGNLKSGGK